MGLCYGGGKEAGSHDVQVQLWQRAQRRGLGGAAHPHLFEPVIADEGLRLVAVEVDQHLVKELAVRHEDVQRPQHGDDLPAIGAREARWRREQR